MCVYKYVYNQMSYLSVDLRAVRASLGECVRVPVCVCVCELVVWQLGLWCGRAGDWLHGDQLDLVRDAPSAV